MPEWGRVLQVRPSRIGNWLIWPGCSRILLGLLGGVGKWLALQCVSRIMLLIILSRKERIRIL
jgi:hypothetical protein